MAFDQITSVFRAAIVHAGRISGFRQSTAPVRFVDTAVEKKRVCMHFVLEATRQQQHAVCNILINCLDGCQFDGIYRKSPFILCSVYASTRKFNLFCCALGNNSYGRYACRAFVLLCIYFYASLFACLRFFRI